MNEHDKLVEAADRAIDAAPELEAEHPIPKHMRSSAPNAHARANRFVKVQRMVEAIDVELGYVAGGRAADAVADQLEVWPDEAWVQLAWKARVLRPSAATVGEVVETFRRRGLIGQKI